MKDALGDRMKSNYESCTRTFLPRRNYTLIRVDGRAFHTLTRTMEKPFDQGFICAMNATAEYLCQNIMGAQFAFTQSDEISVLVTDFARIGTEAWYGNNLQKMCSVSAGLATEAFNKSRILNFIKSFNWNNSLYNEYSKSEELLNSLEHYISWGVFDSRVFQIPQRTEVINYFRWRQQDTVRNSISSVAHSLYSQKELQGKNSSQLQELIFQKGTNWNELDAGLKRGRVTVKTSDGRGFLTHGAPDFIKEDGISFMSEKVLVNEITFDDKI